MDQSALISVIVPMYNQQHFIRKCIKSIIGQTYKNLEIIVVNDGSTDDSAKIAQHLAFQDNRILVINQENLGPAIARKNGYLEAIGSWIVFVDSDDFLPSDSIESLYEAAISKGAEIVCGDLRRKWGPVSRYLHAFPREMGMRTIKQPELFDSYYVSFFGINLFPVNACGKIYRKSVIDQAMKDVDIFTTPLLHRSEDEAFTLQLFPYLSSVYCLEKAIYVYRFGGVTAGNLYFSEMLDFSDFRIGLLDKYKYDKGYTPLFVEYVNILITIIQQGLAFRVWGVDKARAWLEKELNDRYLMRRMEDYYYGKTDISRKCQLALNHDVKGIIDLAESKSKQQWFRSLLRKILLWASSQ